MWRHFRYSLLNPHKNLGITSLCYLVQLSVFEAGDAISLGMRADLFLGQDKVSQGWSLGKFACSFLRQIEGLPSSSNTHLADRVPREGSSYVNQVHWSFRSLKVLCLSLQNCDWSNYYPVKKVKSQIFRSYYIDKICFIISELNWILQFQVFLFGFFFLLLFFKEKQNHLINFKLAVTPNFWLILQIKCTEK